MDIPKAISPFASEGIFVCYSFAVSAVNVYNERGQYE